MAAAQGRSSFRFKYRRVFRKVEVKNYKQSNIKRKIRDFVLVGNCVNFSKEINRNQRGAKWILVAQNNTREHAL